MIGHQHPRPDRNAISRAMGFEGVTIKRIIIGGEKRLRAAIAALRDMIWDAGNDEAEKTGYGVRSSERGRRRQFSALSS